MENLKTEKCHKPFCSVSKTRFIFLILFTTLAFYSSANSQELRPEPTPSPVLGCVIRVDHDHWKKNQPALIHGYIVNLTDRDLKLSLQPTLELVSESEKGKSKITKKNYWSAVNLLMNEPLVVNGGMLLNISKRGKVDFVVDAMKMKWTYIISALWPHEPLYKAAEKGVYYLTVEIGSIVQSNSIRVVLE